MLLTNVWWSNVSAKIPTIVPSAPNSSRPNSVAGISTSGSRTGTSVIGIATTAMPMPIASARSTPPTL